MLFGPLALADVLHDAEKISLPAIGRFAYAGDRLVDPHDRAVLAEETRLERVGSQLSADELLYVIHMGRPIVGMHEFLQSLATELGRVRIPQDLGEAAVRQEQGPVLADMCDTNGRLLERFAEPVLYLRESLPRR